MLVKATKAGFIYGNFHQPGDKINLVDVSTKSGTSTAEDQFSAVWMEKLEEKPKTRAKRKSKADV